MIVEADTMLSVLLDSDPLMIRWMNLQILEEYYVIGDCKKVGKIS